MSRRSAPQLPTNPDELDGVVKAAILLLSLDREAASALLGQLPVEMVQDVTRVVAQLGEVPRALSAAVVEEFYGLRLSAGGAAEGGLDYAKQLLDTALDPAAAQQVRQRIESHVQQPPFSAAHHIPPEQLLTFIQDEHPQTLALVFSHLPNDKASALLAALPADRQVEVARRMAHMEQISPEVIDEVEAGISALLSELVAPAAERVGGVEAVAEVLNLCDRNTEKAILEGIEVEDPELVDQIRRLMFVFEDILQVDDKGIQAVLKEVDNDELCLSLKTASESLREKIFTNMSTRAADLIREEMEYLGPVRLSDVENAQQRIVDIVRRLEDAGEIIVAGRGGESDIVV